MHRAAASAARAASPSSTTPPRRRSVRRQCWCAWRALLLDLRLCMAALVVAARCMPRTRAPWPHCTGPPCVVARFTDTAHASLWPCVVARPWHAAATTLPHRCKVVYCKLIYLQSPHVQDYARHPPTFLVQNTVVDENADTCAAINYHDTMIANGAHSVLALIPVAKERCVRMACPTPLYTHRQTAQACAPHMHTHTHRHTHTHTHIDCFTSWDGTVVNLVSLRGT